MPKLGMEPIRRAALVDAAIHEIGGAGSLDVTVSQIAKRAGVSSGLAHHYFGSKEQIFLAAMQSILRSLGAMSIAEQRESRTAQERLDAIIATSFSEDSFEPSVISAWLIFYVKAQNSTEAMRLLNIYTRRLHSNLMFALRQLMPKGRANQVATTVGALIDGFYIRQALQTNSLDRFQTMGAVWDYLNLKLEQGSKE